MTSGATKIHQRRTTTTHERRQLQHDEPFNSKWHTRARKSYLTCVPLPPLPPSPPPPPSWFAFIDKIPLNHQKSPGEKLSGSIAYFHMPYHQIHFGFWEEYNVWGSKWNIIPFPTRMDLCVSVSTILTREKSPNNKWKNFSQLIPAFRHPQPYPCANVNAFPPLQVVVFYYNFDIITSYVRRSLFMKMHHLSHLELFTLSGSGSLSLGLFVSYHYSSILYGET